MSVLRTKPNSPFIFLSYYSPETKRKTEFSLKLPDTREGWKLAREFKKRFDAEKALGQISAQHGITHRVNTTLIEGLNEFLASRKYSNKPLKPKSEKCYKMAARHFKTFLKDREINTYTSRDAKAFIEYMEKRELSIATQGINTRHLSALWKYFISKGYAKENIILIVPPQKGDPTSIPFDEVQIILDYFKTKNILHYNFIYFLLITGMRVSSALAQTWEDVHFDNGTMRVYNVKADRYFFFPIHKELEEHLYAMKPKPNGRIFDYINQETPIFWRRGIVYMKDHNIVKKRYKLHQFRKTFGSWGAQAGIEVAALRELYNHSSERVTQEHYVEMQTIIMKQLLDRIKFRKTGQMGVTLGVTPEK